MENKKGFSILEVIFGIAIFGLIVFSYTTVQSGMANHKLKIASNEIMYSEVNKELTRLYSEGWDYEEKTIPTKIGDLKVSLVEQNTSQHLTDVAEVTFEKDDFEVKYIVERSYSHEQ